MSTISTISCSCPHCGGNWSCEAYDVINVSENPELKEQVISGAVFLNECPHCGHKTVSSRPIIYMDPQEMLLVILTQESLNMDDTQGYTARMVSRAGDLIEKVKIFDSGLDDVAIEMCKYVTRQELGKNVDMKFLRMDGADNEIILTYPQGGQMEMLSIGFNVYEDCRGIISRNPVIGEKTKGLVRVDETWLNQFFR